MGREQHFAIKLCTAEYYFELTNTKTHRHVKSLFNMVQNDKNIYYQHKIQCFACGLELKMLILSLSASVDLQYRPQN